MGRRTFVKGLGASAVGAAGLASTTDSADALAVSGTAAIAIGGAVAGAAGGAGLAYLARDQIEGLLGESENLSGYTGKDALRTQIYTQAQQLLTVDERVMTSITNNLSTSETIAFAKGKAAALKAMNAEEGESKAKSQMEKAVDDYYSTIQKNIVTHADQQAGVWRHHLNMVSAHQSLSVTGMYRANKHNDESITGYNEFKSTETILNGTEVEYRCVEFTYPYGTVTDSRISIGSNEWGGLDGGFQDYGTINYMDMGPYDSAYSDAAARADTVKTKLDGFVTDLYAEYGAGDIPTEDIIDPVTAATELGQNTGMAGQAAEAAMLGIPTSASFSLWLELQDGDGNTSEVKAEMYTNASPTDSDGNETGWEVGTTYDPANFDAPIYIAYEYIKPDSGEKSSDFIELEHPFTVIEATDEEGNEVTNVQNEKRITQTADVSKLEEELAQLRDEQQRLQEESQKEVSGGGGGGFLSGDLGSDTKTLGIVAGGAALAALLFGNN